MRNIQFLLAGIIIVILIVAATLLFDQQEPVPVIPDNGGEVVDGDNTDGVTPTTEKIKVKVYFSSTKLDPQVERCNEVYPVEREIEPTFAVGKESLEALLAGVTDAEQADGYFSSLNAEARVESLTIMEGVATVVFNEAFAVGLGGSCKVAAIRAQIEQTLKQFPTVQTVVIKVVGVPDEEVLQP